MEKIINNTIPAVKIIIYKKENGLNKFLMVIEPEGEYGFVGGAQDVGDKTLKQAAIRELLEEVGLSEKSCKLKQTEIIEYYMHTDKASERYGKNGKVYGFFAEYNGLEEINLESVLQGFEWVDEKDILKKLENSHEYLRKIFSKTLKLIN